MTGNGLPSTKCEPTSTHVASGAEHSRAQPPTPGTNSDEIRIVPMGQTRQGRRWSAGRIDILSLAGDATDIGTAHGQIIGQAATDGCIPRLSSAAFQLEEIAELSPIQRTVAHLYVAHLYRRIWAGLPAVYRAEMHGLANAAALPVTDVFRASFLSEVLQLLACGSKPRSAGASVAVGGCTAAVAGTGEAPFGLLHGKNQDYDAAGTWDGFPLLLITRLAGAHAYAKATSAGLLKGNLSLNSAGLSIGGHFLLSQRAGSRGLTFTVIENEVMRRAATLGQAIDLMRGSPRLGSFAFVVTDAAAARAAVIECDGDAVAVREAENGTLGMSNLYTTKLAAADLLRALRMHRNPNARQSRIDDLLQRPGSATVETIAAALADQWDPTVGLDRGIGHTVANPLSVMTAIARPGAHHIWMSEAEAPTSIGRFIGFDLSAAFDGGEPKLLGTFDTLGGRERTTEAARVFVRAKLAFESENVGHALGLLQQGADEMPKESAFPRFIARLCLRALDVGGAQAALVRCRDTSLSISEGAEVELLSGHCLDLTGERAAAAAAYANVIGKSETYGDGVDGVAAALTASARKYQKRPFGRDDAGKLGVAFSLVSGTE